MWVPRHVAGSDQAGPRVNAPGRARVLQGDAARCRESVDHLRIRRRRRAQRTTRYHTHVCNDKCLEFVRTAVAIGDVAGRRVLEVGAFDVNGSPRPFVSSLGPASYLGIDIANGPGVDRICPAEQIVGEFGRESFDVIISTEMVEHVRDWRLVISNMKQALAPNGLLVVTTRSLGFPLHEYPGDYWRYEASDMRIVFADCDIELLEKDDPADPGIFVAVRRPQQFEELDLLGHALYSMVCEGRVTTIEEAEARLRAATELTTLRSELSLLQKETNELSSQLATAVRREASLRSELDALRNTRTFRYTARLRRAYSDVRTHRGQTTLPHSGRR